MNFHQFTPDPDALAARLVERSEAAAADPGGSPTQLPASAVSPPPTNLQELTALRDRQFIEAAYRLLLRREADPQGSEVFLERLRSGAASKIDILGDLRYSPEGEQQRVDLPGLHLRYRLRRLGRTPAIGGAVRWLLTLLQLPKLLRAVETNRAAIEQATVAAEDTRALDAGEIQDLIGALNDLRRQMTTLTMHLATRADRADAGIREIDERLARLNDALTARVDTYAAKLANAEATFEVRHERLDVRHRRIAEANAVLTRQIRELYARSSTPAAPLPAGAEGATAVVPSGPADFDRFYVDFEDRLRGTREEIKRRQEVYLDYASTANAGTAARPILDLGCGRGEWLELLQEHGRIARGVDLNRVMVAETRHRGVDVVEADAIDYLEALPAGSVGMVTGFHIIEHLPFEVLVRLFDECHRVLHAGGCIAFETPNPENLVVGAYTFYFDPTHRNPLPPKLTEFLAQHRGFTDVEILRLHPRAEDGPDEPLINTWFRQATDYAVIAWKDGRPG